LKIDVLLFALLVFVVESNRFNLAPKASLANGTIHGIRGEVGAVRPLNCAQHNSDIHPAFPCLPTERFTCPMAKSG
jgi:hypothetical protein